MKRKSLLTSIILILGLGAYTALNTSYSTGFNGNTANCSGCHGTDPNTIVSITGLPGLMGYNPGATYPISVTVINPSKLAAGFDLQASAGSFTNPGAGVAVNGSTASHTGGATAMVAGMATFNLSWQAPNPGVSIVNFTAEGNAVNLNSAASGDGANSFTTLIGLPVNFTKLSAIPSDSYIELSFNTSDEELIKQFEIERSVDGDVFEKIKTVHPKGDSKYSYLDHTVISNILYYYRIKEVSIDGMNTFSSVISSKITSRAASDILIYPTVISNSKVSLEGLNFSELNIAEVYDMSGKKLQTQIIKASFLELDQLKKGFYILNIKTNNRSVKTQRIMIL